jgi:hypothetical protein
LEVLFTAFKILFAVCRFPKELTQYSSLLILLWNQIQNSTVHKIYLGTRGFLFTLFLQCRIVDQDNVFTWIRFFGADNKTSKLLRIRLKFKAPLTKPCLLELLIATKLAASFVYLEQAY